MSTAQTGLRLARSLGAPRASAVRQPRRGLAFSPRPRQQSQPHPDHIPNSAQPPPTQSATAIFYRQLVPAMLHSIALGSILYMALELTHNFIEREFVAEKLQKEVDRLEAELEQLKSGGKVGGGSTEGGRSWWKLW